MDTELDVIADFFLGNRQLTTTMVSMDPGFRASRSAGMTG
jgi:hypothetical protein